ncbi:Ubiquinone biosynthesis O-methyltransferase [Planctomycetes bacterium Poly30]|uniref:Ubiquinone biosynthesis O-methyltransferase n=1 Tax=Saltatorellus ferox TaxID=2528018 RepID=A0A518EP70_9BACT|nr:Ubiquinone biosynthesis O-methyltransferase [Planctomycetes bacterium Poly30]
MAQAQNDLEIYDREADAWWDGSDRFFRSLRSVKEFHLELLLERWASEPSGARVVDLGCGGGLFSMALADRGADVVGVDLSGPSLGSAAREAGRRGHAAQFVRGDLTSSPVRDGWADLVLLSDVLEHVEDPKAAVIEAGRLLRPGGTLLLNTFDRRPGAGLLVVTVAEGLGLVPKGTHDPAMFVRPAEVDDAAREAGMTRTHLVWEAPSLVKTVRTWTIHMRRAPRGFAYTALYEKAQA